MSDKTTAAKTIDAARSALLKPLVKQELNQWETILSLQEAIEAARAAGKTVEQMHADLMACGLNIKFGTFRKYVSDLTDLSTRKPVKPPRKKSPPRQSVVETSAPDLVLEPNSQSLRNIRTGRGPGIGT